ncbi:predicted protein [Arabidopsis lyrata subsp. lyrata]|uniref:Predicted protein n=1 Tax=Arabidopsis lyrata subsp. lyrata TaxID=81972 RepID=D7L4N1_ARALL|nr:predicted protein [Arabidopsis lyrata subsp. lyrata]
MILFNKDVTKLLNISATDLVKYYDQDANNDKDAQTLKIPKKEDRKKDDNSSNTNHHEETKSKTQRLPKKRDNTSTGEIRTVKRKSLPNKRVITSKEEMTNKDENLDDTEDETPIAKRAQRKTKHIINDDFV